MSSYHSFNDVKKAFAHVCYEGLWRVLKEYNIDKRLIELIKSSYDEATVFQDIFRPEVVSDVISGEIAVPVGMKVRVKFGDPRSNRFRDI